MDLLQPDKLWLFLFFALPGLVGLFTWDALVPTHERKAPEQLLRGVTFSIVNAILLWPLVECLAPVAPRWALWLGSAVVLLVVPAVEAYALRALLASRWMRAAGGLRHPMPTAWDHFFARGETCWLVMHLKSGQKIAGYFGMESFASSFPHPEQVYIEAVWILDDRDPRKFSRQAPGSAGAIVSMADCESIEAFRDEPGTTT